MASPLDHARTLLQHLLPQQSLSRAVYRITRIQTPWFKNALIRTFIRAYDVDMSQAVAPDAENYPHFDAFFTRHLKPEARPLDASPDTVLCPVDGTISEIGRIEGDRLYQAKRHRYRLADLLGSERLAHCFEEGHFATLYLSPQDYHRIHMPLSGRLTETHYLPGRLFSVAPYTTQTIGNLFARNERLVTVFDTCVGPMAVILVGAVCVSGIETCWSGLSRTTDRPGRHMRSYQDAAPPVELAAGAELGCFHMGSTVIVLFGRDRVTWQEDLVSGGKVRMGERLGARRSTD